MATSIEIQSLRQELKRDPASLLDKQKRLHDRARQPFEWHRNNDTVDRYAMNLKAIEHTFDVLSLPENWMIGHQPPHVAMSAPNNTSDFHSPHAEFSQSLDICFRQPADTNNQDIQLLRFFGGLL